MYLISVFAFFSVTPTVQGKKLLIVGVGPAKGTKFDGGDIAGVEEPPPYNLDLLTFAYEQSVGAAKEIAKKLAVDGAIPPSSNASTTFWTIDDKCGDEYDWQTSAYDRLTKVTKYEYVLHMGLVFAIATNLVMTIGRIDTYWATISRLKGELSSESTNISYSSNAIVHFEAGPVCEYHWQYDVAKEIVNYAADVKEIRKLKSSTFLYATSTMTVVPGPNEQWVIGDKTSLMKNFVSLNSNEEFLGKMLQSFSDNYVTKYTTLISNFMIYAN
uniref:Uncharacterized protein n=1 Tax=Romanomermis culicivorax TaxID=13658 RepID=A0A915HYS5_ROMCU